MLHVITSPSRFPLGQIVATANALASLTPPEIADGLQRHSQGDWGDICPGDAELNNEALQQGDRLLSVYGTKERTFWIITEADRSVTTILLPEDY